ncbi:hypothetical protein HUN07_00500 [Rhodococcus sp. W8901]|nr:hypothetical protein [Rhodococcus sp. W8901]QKT09316.1 hypothetical protein HUN07_00500 [Rhodococcus sp. W8901]
MAPIDFDPSPEHHDEIDCADERSSFNNAVLTATDAGALSRSFRAGWRSSPHRSDPILFLSHVVVAPGGQNIRNAHSLSQTRRYCT